MSDSDVSPRSGKCTNYAPIGFTGHWRDWHRGHGCDLDDGTSSLPGQSEDTEIVNALTAICREADRNFERVGGSSRHWVRDCFLPLLNAKGWQMSRVALAGAPAVQPATLENLTADEQRCLLMAIDDVRNGRIKSPAQIDVKAATPVVPPSNGPKISFYEDRAVWYREGCQGLEDREGYYASGDCAKDAAADIFALCSRVRDLEAALVEALPCPQETTAQDS
jgi:hypothetical protein